MQTQIFNLQLSDLKPNQKFRFVGDRPEVEREVLKRYDEWTQIYTKFYPPGTAKENWHGSYQYYKEKYNNNKVEII